MPSDLPSGDHREPALPHGVARLDAAVEELRHATYGLYGPHLRQGLLDRLGWTWSPIHYRLLRVVEGTEPVRPTVGDVGAALLVDKARATRLVAQLREAGLVGLEVGRLDRRRREVVLTDAGRTVLANARRIRLDLLDEALRGWDPSAVADLADLLARLNDAVRELA